eukprot:263871_1
MASITEQKTDVIDAKNLSGNRPLYHYIYLILLIETHGLSIWFRVSLSPITDVLEHEFNTTTSGIGILSSVFFIVYVVSQIPVGLFLQIHDAALTLVFSTFGLCILCLIFPLTTPSLTCASVVRALAGFVTAPIWISGISLIGELFGNNNLSLCVAIVAMSGGVHIFMGNILQAEMYKKYHNWTAVYFFVSIILLFCGIGFLSCVFCERKYKASAIKNNKHCTFKRIKNINDEQSDMKISTCKKLKISMLKTLSLWLNWHVAFIAFLYGIIYYGAAGLWLVPYLMTKYSYSRSLAAFISGLLYLSASVSFIIYGEWTRRIKKRKIFIVVSGILYISFVIFIYVPALPLWLVVSLNLITGIASGVFPILFTLTREYNWYYNNEETSTAFINMILGLSASFCQYIVGLLLDLNHKETEYTVKEYNFAFMIIPIGLGIALFFSLFLKETNGTNVDWGENSNDLVSTSFGAPIYGQINSAHDITATNGSEMKIVEKL